MFFFFNDTATTEIYTLSLHDALPISAGNDGPDQNTLNPYSVAPWVIGVAASCSATDTLAQRVHCQPGDRKSTRLNSSHSQISYAVFCLKKKNKHNILHSAVTADRLFQ